LRRSLYPIALVALAGGAALADSTLYDFDQLLGQPYPLSPGPAGLAAPPPDAAPPFTSGVPLPPPPRFDTAPGFQYGRPPPPETAPVTPSAEARGTSTGHIDGMLGEAHPFDTRARAAPQRTAPAGPAAPIVLQRPAPEPTVAPTPAAAAAAAPALAAPRPPPAAAESPPPVATAAPPPAPEPTSAAPEPAAPEPAAPEPVATAEPPPAPEPVAPEPVATAEPPPAPAPVAPEQPRRESALASRDTLDAVSRDGLYLAGQFATFYQPDSTVTGAGADIEANYEVGFGGLGAVGYAFDFGLRVEAEVGYRQASVDSFDVRSAGGLPITAEGGRSSSNGTIAALSGLASAFYEFDTGGRFGPYLGGGLGVARVDVNNWRAGGNIADDSDTVFAYQLGAGTSYDLGGALKLDVGYRYFATDDPSVTSSTGSSLTVDYETHNVVVGLRFGL